jgi:hypothetical protein
MTKDPLVAVTWRDPRVDQVTTYTREEVRAATPMVFTTFGLLIRDDEEEVAVAGEICHDGSFRGVTHIMRALVKEIVVLGTWPKARRARGRKGGAPARAESSESPPPPPHDAVMPALPAIVAPSAPSPPA